MYFKENVFQGNYFNAGQQQLSTRPCPGTAAAQKAKLASGASPCPSSRSLPLGLHQGSLCRTKDTGNEALEEDSSLQSAIIWQFVMCSQPHCFWDSQNKSCHSSRFKITRLVLQKRKQYLSHIWFWESYNSHKSWVKLSSITLINCAQKNRIEANLFQSTLELKVHYSPTAFSFHYKKVDSCLLQF